MRGERTMDATWDELAPAIRDRMRGESAATLAATPPGEVFVDRSTGRLYRILKHLKRWAKVEELLDTGAFDAPEKLRYTRNTSGVGTGRSYVVDRRGAVLSDVELSAALAKIQEEIKPCESN